MAAEADKISAKLQSYSVASQLNLLPMPYCDVVAHAWLMAGSTLSACMAGVARGTQSVRVAGIPMIMHAHTILIRNTIVLCKRHITPKVLFILL